LKAKFSEIMRDEFTKFLSFIYNYLSYKALSVSS